jgi:hypothetical protein
MNQKDPIFSRLPDVRAWQREHRPLSPLDFVALEGRPSLLFAYSSLLDPDLENVDGRFFLSNRFDRELLDNWEAKGVKGAEAQRVINHIHMSYLMQDECSDVEILDAAAVAVSNTWRKTLPAGVTVEIIGAQTEDVSVTFFQLNIVG